MDAILLVLRTGMQWNALNATGICSSSSAHRRFQEWTKAGVFEELWRRALAGLRQAAGDRVGVAGDGRRDHEGAAGRRAHRPEPHRPGEKGAKRSLLTEGRGIPFGICAEGANRNDFKLTRETLESIPIRRPKPTRNKPQNLCLDKGYDYQEVRELAREFGFTAHIRSRGEEQQQLAREAGFRARRWVVERTHSWLNRFRAILIRWSKKPENHLALLHFACAIITWKAARAEPLPG